MAGGASSQPQPHPGHRLTKPTCATIQPPIFSPSFPPPSFSLLQFDTATIPPNHIYFKSGPEHSLLSAPAEAEREKLMADYYDDRGRYDEPRRYKSTRTRPRERDDADYVEETTYVERGKGRPPQDLVYHGRDDSAEDIPRDFSPPAGRRPRGYDDYGPPPVRRARSATSRRDRYDDDDDDDYLPAAAGAAGGYAVGRANRGRDRGDNRRRDRDSYYSDDDQRSPPRKQDRKKSGVEGMLESLGLGGVAGALAGKSKSGRSRSRDRDGGRSRSRPRGEKKQREWAQAAQAALIAGAIEAFKSRGEPGSWTGMKGRRIATAAIGAGGIDKLVDRDPDHKSKRHLVEAVLGGLAANRLANGPAHSASEDGRGRGRSRSRSVFSRYRSKSRRGRSSESGGSRSRGVSTGDKIKDVGAGVVLAGVGKQLYDRIRSKSRKRRSPSTGSEDSYEASRNRRRDRDVGGPYSQSRGGPPDESAVLGPRGRSAAAVGGEQGLRGDKKRDSSTDSESSTDMERRRRKMRGKEFLTAGLASVATIHAAHAVYQSMEASEKRHKLVAEGEMTPEEARKKRSKAWLQDAAAVGIAALGIKGAYSEWKEMNEQRHSVKELEDRRRARQKRRERRMKEAMNGQTGNGGGHVSGGSGPYMSGGAGGFPATDDRYGPSRYQDGNPYGPPPPVGYGR